MTKMCEAYSRRGMDPVTPMPVQFFRSVQSRPGAGQREPSRSKGFGLLAYLCVKQIRRGEGGYMYTEPCQIRAMLCPSQSHSICGDT